MHPLLYREKISAKPGHIHLHPHPWRPCFWSLSNRSHVGRTGEHRTGRRHFLRRLTRIHLETPDLLVQLPPAPVHFFGAALVWRLPGHFLDPVDWFGLCRHNRSQTASQSFSTCIQRSLSHLLTHSLYSTVTCLSSTPYRWSAPSNPDAIFCLSSSSFPSWSEEVSR